MAETAIDQVAGRATVVIGCTSLTARGAGRARPPCDGRRRRRDRVDAAALLEDVPRRDGALLPGHLGRRRRAADGLQLAARHERRHRSRPRRADRRGRQRRRDQGQHAEPRAVLRDDAPRRRQRAGVRPVHVRRRASSSCWSTAATGSSAAARCGARRTRSSGRPCGAATRSPHASTRGAPTSCSRSSGCPAAGAVSTAPTRASSRR